MKTPQAIKNMLKGWVTTLLSLVPAWFSVKFLLIFVDKLEAGQDLDYTSMWWAVGLFLISMLLLISPDTFVQVAREYLTKGSSDKNEDESPL